VLELDELHRRFGDVVALDGMTFSVQAGKVAGFLGPNGAGKTTAMRAVLGVTALDAGTISFDGREVDAHARRHFGYMPEERGLYPGMRVLDQLEYLGRLHGMDAAAGRGSARRQCERLGLAERVDSKVEELSAVICLLVTVATARLAATIYERSILRTGARVRLREALRSEA
jgi:ABC-2 type transport system ATP-binding protein